MFDGIVTIGSTNDIVTIGALDCIVTIDVKFEILVVFVDRYQREKQRLVVIEHGAIVRNRGAI